MNKILDPLDRALAAVENGLIVAIVTLMVGFAFIQIVLRLWQAQFLWGDIVLRHLVLWVGFIGASLATRDDKHIGINILQRLMKGRWKHLTRALVHIATIVVCLVLVSASYDFVMSEKEFGTVLFDEVPAWMFQIIIPIGFGLIALRLLINTLREIAAIFNPLPDVEEEVA
ncbi:MAG TPA: TRAP transporter small permease [Calditrichia bacterium]|nr:TRAP transporter small permease subunit [Calditrichota bacterium]HQU72586.1 TRAP transporter small permease [Calditrichia bacterium]HQV33369.1 TRAP transporter small permease [Calditrichia bacterium]